MKVQASTGSCQRGEKTSERPSSRLLCVKPTKKCVASLFRVIRLTFCQSGYQVEFLPLFIPTNAPPPPGSHEQHRSPITEPIYVSTFAWKPRRRINGAVPGAHGGEYLTFWYAGQIPEDAVHHLNTGMPDEQDYQSHSLNIEDALQVLDSTYQPVEHHVLATAYELWRETQKILTERSQ
ncbi:hypothetical protein CERSUDRAFT_54362 [Gelatoporia subvermispora B]|uniref:Uncharacterized protein n=1 Tax=Ceriporiopsis subvermispora (strain B) TaxID=914234 RepID=M2QRZ0_CERS8|nr:hypothetical protein CERSUDRAFT_54362 [Gelatoporia subvermispora B]